MSRFDIIAASPLLFYFLSLPFIRTAFLHAARLMPFPRLLYARCAVFSRDAYFRQDALFTSNIIKTHANYNSMLLFYAL